MIGAILLEKVQQKHEAVFHNDASIASPFLHDDSQEKIKGVLKGHNLLDVGIPLGQTSKEQETLQMNKKITMNRLQGH